MFIYVVANSNLYIYRLVGLSKKNSPGVSHVPQSGTGHSHQTNQPNRNSLLSINRALFSCVYVKQNSNI